MTKMPSGSLTPALDIAAIADLAVFDACGLRYRLGESWAERPAVLVFLRHFGCVTCREQVTELRPSIERIHELGAELVLVGNGSPEAAGALREEFQLSVPVYADPQRRSYRALGLQRSLFSTIRWRAVRNVIAALRRGVSQRGLQGDAWQQGGCVIVLPDGSVPFYFASRAAGDHPSPETILDELRRATVGTSPAPLRILSGSRD
jgi:peroxiredoxin